MDRREVPRVCACSVLRPASYVCTIVLRKTRCVLIRSAAPPVPSAGRPSPKRDQFHRRSKSHTSRRLFRSLSDALLAVVARIAPRPSTSTAMAMLWLFPRAVAKAVLTTYEDVVVPCGRIGLKRLHCKGFESAPGASGSISASYGDLTCNLNYAFAPNATKVPFMFTCTCTCADTCADRDTCTGTTAWLRTCECTYE